jgi:hypothetical protein
VAKIEQAVATNASRYVTYSHRSIPSVVASALAPDLLSISAGNSDRSVLFGNLKCSAVQCSIAPNTTDNGQYSQLISRVTEGTRADRSKAQRQPVVVVARSGRKDRQENRIAEM